MDSKIIILLVILSVLLFISLSLPKSELIQVEELRDWIINKKDFVLVDIRDSNNYSLSHIRGAINIPVMNMSEEEIVRSFRELKEKFPNREIVIYCYRGRLAARISELLANNSIYVRRLPIGWLDIKDRFPEISTIE